MFEVEKKFRFEAGHVLGLHKGACSRPHGHSYELYIVLSKDGLSEEGMVVDFGDISIVVKPMIEKYFDHHWLNQTLDMEQPTAERMAKWIFDYLKPDLPNLVRVRLCETDTCSATYIG